MDNLFLNRTFKSDYNDKAKLQTSLSGEENGNVTWFGYNIGIGPSLGGSLNISNTNKIRKLW